MDHYAVGCRNNFMTLIVRSCVKRINRFSILFLHVFSKFYCRVFKIYRAITNFVYLNQ